MTVAAEYSAGGLHASAGSDRHTSDGNMDPWEPQSLELWSILTMTKQPIIPGPYAGQWALMSSCRRELVGRSTGHARWAHTTLSELATNPQVLGG